MSGYSFLQCFPVYSTGTYCLLTVIFHSIFTIIVYNTIQYLYSAVKFITGKFVEDIKKLILTFNPCTRLCHELFCYTCQLISKITNLTFFFKCFILTGQFMELTRRERERDKIGKRPQLGTSIQVAHSAIRL